MQYKSAMVRIKAANTLINTSSSSPSLQIPHVFFGILGGMEPFEMDHLKLLFSSNRSSQFH